MCGIACSINYALDLNKIKDSMFHRGPDEQRNAIVDNVHLYHLRLAIVDIESGKQPMSLLDRYTIIYNGEIYNYKDLNKKYNLTVQTSSDTETILHLYHKLGPSFLHECDGMFAIVIYDRLEKQLFVARDRAGKKPFYYHQSDATFFASSELNCLSNSISTDINHDVFQDYLVTGTFYRTSTPFKNVKELEGGHYMIIDTTSLEVKKVQWWKYEDFFTEKLDLSFSEASAKIDDHLTTAIKRRMLSSDLEVGSFLSGGIDSGLVSAIASGYTDKLKTFTVSFPGSYDEAPLARLVAQKYNTHHTEIKIGFDSLENDIEDILLNYGEPFFDSSAIPSYYVSKAAKEHVTVVLNGDGADELFGGYRRYVPFAKKDWFQTSRLTRKSSGIIKSLLPLPSNKKSNYNLLFRLLNFVSKEGLDMYLSAGVDIFEGYKHNFVELQKSSPLLIDFNSTIDLNLSGLDKILVMDFNTILFSDLLVKMDIATMAWSLEGRSPFLCKELLEFSPKLKSGLKIKGNETKSILRFLAQKYLPDELIYQPKRGFEIPLMQWVNNQLKDIINDYLSSQEVLWPRFIDKKWFNNLLQNKIKVHPEKRAKMIWTVFSMEVWYRNYRSNNG